MADTGTTRMINHMESLATPEEKYDFLCAVEQWTHAVREELHTDPPEDPYHPGYGVRCRFKYDAQGFPAGGTITGRGMTIHLQAGPRGQGDERRKPNGADLELILKAAQELVMHYQNSAAPSPHNSRIAKMLAGVLDEVDRRKTERHNRGVLGANIE